MKDYYSARDIQNFIIERAKKLGFKNLFVTSMEIQQPDNLPAIAVLFVRETMNSLGPAGAPEFRHQLTIAIQASVVSSDAEDQRVRIFDALENLDLALLVDQESDDLWKFAIEDITRIDRTISFEKRAETPVAHLNSTITMQFTSTWQPSPLDDFKVLHVETVFPIGGDAASVEQVKAEWDIEQE